MKRSPRYAAIIKCFGIWITVLPPRLSRQTEFFQLNTEWAWVFPLPFSRTLLVCRP